MPLIPSLDKPSSRFNPIDLSYVKENNSRQRVFRYGEAEIVTITDLRS